jgi:hypothetical protein
MAANSYLGMDPAERERQALYSASSRVAQPRQPQTGGSGTMAPQQRPLTGGLAGLNSGGTSFRPGSGPAYTSMIAGAGADIAGRQATNALTRGGTSALTGASTPAWASGVAGMGAGIGINMAGNALADRVRVKEDPVNFGENDQWADLMGRYGRRHEGTGGGVHSGAIRGATMGSNPALLAATGGISAGVGALGGAIAALATKNAPSAYTDFAAGDGARGIQDAYQQFLGRQGSDEEILGHMRNVGFRPEQGHRWLGQDATFDILSAVRDSPEAAAYAQQLGGGAPTAGVPTALSPAPPAGGEGQFTSPGAGMPTGLDDLTGGNTGVTGGTAGATPTATEPQAANPAWDTDGYGAPQATAQNFNTTPPGGWDREKWNNPNHQTPKYVWGRFTQDDDPDDIGQMLRAYPGAQFDGKDKITGIPGLGPIDVYQGASQGGKTPQWYDINAAAAEGSQGGSPGGMAFGPGPGGTRSAAFAAGQAGGDRSWSSDSYSNLVMQYLLQGLGLDRAAARLE